MITNVFNYEEDKKPFPESYKYKQGFLMQWDGDKKQLWIWGFDKEKLKDPEALKTIVASVLEDFLKS